MRRLIAHVGMGKTGTTTIQRSLVGYEKSGMRFCSFGKMAAEQAVAAIFSDAPEAIQFLRRQGAGPREAAKLRDRFRAELVQQLEGTDADFIVSSETIPNLSESELERFHAFFSKYFDEISYIAYIRPPRSYMQSMFQQRVVGGLARLALPLPHYRRRYEPFIRLFGRERVSLVKFDRSTLYKGDALEDFCHRIGIEMPDNVFNVNTGIGLEGCCLLYAQNKLGTGNFGDPLSARARAQLRNVVARIPSVKMCLSTRVLKRFDDADDTRWMEQVAGFSLEEAPDPRGEKINSEAHMLGIAKRALPKFKIAAAEYLMERFMEGDEPHTCQTRFMEFLKDFKLC